ncbi:MAG: hypothetical protein KAJ90_08215 [Desulfobacterales bacterium]|nr:hypothetical protein [Desulfobacterales bacterium]
MPITLTRSLLVILIPGGVFMIPWLITIAIVSEKNLSFYTTYSMLFNILGFAMAVIVGMFLEGFNTFIEYRWDKEREEKYLVAKNWYDYLSVACEKETVGFRYIGNRVTTMYFEMAMIWASLSFLVGLMVVVYIMNIKYQIVWLMGMPVSAMVFSFYFYRQAKNTHEVLCKTRMEINERLAALGS